jgi:antirestriction protein ArdC
MIAQREASDKFQIVTDKLIQILEAGVKPWSKPWHSAKSESIFKNLISGHCYSGINPILCLIDCLLLDDERPYFVGFSQAKELGWKLQKGSKSTWLRWGGTVAKEVENEETGESSKQFYNAGKWLNVFHISLFDDSNAKVKIADRIADLDEKPVEINTEARLSEVDNFITATRAKIKHGNGSRAFYTPAVDAIVLPEFSQFTSATAYYATAIHELTHWTGHQTRCDRDLSGSFGSKSYAYEELIAEIGAAFTCNEFGITNEIENHASYIASWLEALKNDKKFFFKAASEARKASEYLLEITTAQLQAA